MGTSNLQVLEALDTEYIRSRAKSHVRLALLSGTVSIDARSTEYGVQSTRRTTYQSSLVGTCGSCLFSKRSLIYACVCTRTLRLGDYLHVRNKIDTHVHVHPVPLDL